MPRATLIQWGSGLGVTDLGSGVIRVDLGASGSGSGHSDTIQFGAGLGVTDLGGGVARIDVGAGGSAVGHATDLQFGDGLRVTDLGGGVIRVDAGDAVRPGPPTLVSADGHFELVDLLWDPPASDGGSPITGYNVYRSLVSGGETLLTSSGTSPGYADGGLTDNTTYFYRVSAVNAVGEGPLSNELSATPDGIMLVTFDVLSPASGQSGVDTFPVTLVTNNNPVVGPTEVTTGNFQAIFPSGAHTHHATLVLDEVPASGLIFDSGVAPPLTFTPPAPPPPFTAPGTYTFDVTFPAGSLVWFEVLGPGGEECKGSFELRYD